MLASSDISSETLDYLDQAIERFGASYLHTPLTELLPEVRATWRQVTRLLDHKHTLSQGRRLHLQLGWLTALLGVTAFDLGAPTKASALLDTARRLAKEVGHRDLTAWIHGSQSMIETYAGRPAEAVKLARAGQRVAGRDSAYVVTLAGSETRACGLLGDVAGATDALRRGKGLVEAAPSLPTSCRTVFGGSRSDPSLFGATAFVRLKQPKRAAEEATRLLAFHVDDPAGAPSDRAVAHIDLAMAAVMRRDPAAACHEAGKALDIYTDERQTSVILLRADELHRAMQRFSADPAIRDFGARLHELRAA